MLVTPPQPPPSLTHAAKVVLAPKKVPVIHQLLDGGPVPAQLVFDDCRKPLKKRRVVRAAKSKTTSKVVSFKEPPVLERQVASYWKSPQALPAAPFVYQDRLSTTDLTLLHEDNDEDMPKDEEDVEAELAFLRPTQDSMGMMRRPAVTPSPHPFTTPPANVQPMDPRFAPRKAAAAMMHSGHGGGFGGNHHRHDHPAVYGRHGSPQVYSPFQGDHPIPMNGFGSSFFAAAAAPPSTQVPYAFAPPPSPGGGVYGSGRASHSGSLWSASTLHGAPGGSFATSAGRAGNDVRSTGPSFCCRRRRRGGRHGLVSTPSRRGHGVPHHTPRKSYPNAMMQLFSPMKLGE